MFSSLSIATAVLLYSLSMSQILFPEEIFWRDRYHFFKRKGYILRPRYHPDWQPSWRFKADAVAGEHEDGIFQWKGALLDATIVGENRKHVFIKRVDLRTHPNEAKIALHLGSLESQQESDNHCVPVLTTFRDEEDPMYEYIVMPVLRPFNDPNFTTFGEVIDFVNQTLKGLVYMHSKNVAHRDCAAENILMDGSNLYKDGWHPMNSFQARDGRRLGDPDRNRADVQIKYYFIDFGLSTYFPPEQRERLVTGDLGRVIAPEQLTGIPYDPFKYDVYVLGTVYQTTIVDQFRGFELLGGMIQLMTKPDPKDRLNAQDTQKLWESLRKLLPPRWTRLRTSEGEGSFERLLNNALDVVGRARESLGL